jgi:FkbM family methyltransferase
VDKRDQRVYPSAVGSIVTRELRIGERMFSIAGREEDMYFSHFAGAGAYTDDLTPLLAATIQPGWTCFDVGANIGLTSIFMYGVKPGVGVVAFEPSPIAVELLRRNIETNHLARSIQTVPVAITDHSGTVAFADMATFLAGSHILDTAVTHPSAVGIAPIQVPSMTLDEYVGAHQVARLDLLKIDVEGHEEQVLRGAAGVLERYRPLTVLEFNGWFLKELQNDQRQQLLDILFATFASVRVVSKTSATATPLANDAASRAAFLEANWAGGGVDNLVCQLAPR